MTAGSADDRNPTPSPGRLACKTPPSHLTKRLASLHIIGVLVKAPCRRAIAAGHPGLGQATGSLDRVDEALHVGAGRPRSPGSERPQQPLSCLSIPHDGAQVMAVPREGRRVKPLVAAPKDQHNPRSDRLSSAQRTA